MSNQEELDHLTTEAQNDRSDGLDAMSSVQIVRLMNAEDRVVVDAVAAVADDVAAAIEIVAVALGQGGRLYYLGAGTSGRLGVLDAVECPPTFGTAPALVQGILAGGSPALVQAVEGAEDDAGQGERDLEIAGVTAKDVVVGITSSGRTPYVLGGLAHARTLGAATVAIFCNAGAPVARHSDQPIHLAVGPEILAGSTRLKAGTATKMVLNMLTTGAMVRLGKTYGNLMVDVQATNQKLQHRALHLVRRLAEVPEQRARELLQQCGWEVKTAVVMQRRRLDVEAARARLARTGGHLRPALAEG